MSDPETIFFEEPPERDVRHEINQTLDAIEYRLNAPKRLAKTIKHAWAERPVAVVAVATVVVVGLASIAIGLSALKKR